MYTFLDHFQDGYKRSQTETKRKILRCFPCCRPLGHRINGYCGSMIRMEVSNLNKNMHFWGAFAPVKDIILELGKEIDTDFFETDTVGSVSNPRVWFQGVIVTLDSPEHAVVQFAPENASWDYSWWSSHRSLSNIQHCFTVVGCVECGKGWQVATVQQSPSFQVYSKSHLNNRRSSGESSDLEPPKKKLSKTSSRGGSSVATESAEERSIGEDSWTHDDIAPDMYQHQNDKSSGWSIIQAIGNEIQNTFGMFQSRPQSLLPSKSTLTIEEIRNLTLDRIVNLFFYPERFQKYQNQQRLRRTFEEKQFLSDFEDIESVFDDAFIFMRFDTTASKLAESWMTQDKIATFKTICEKESDRSFNWVPAREYETFDEENALERSLYARIRNSYRSIFRNSLLIKERQPEDYYDFMEFLSKSGFIRYDPFHPPSIDDGRHIFWQVNGGEYSPEMYSAGSHSFASNSIHERYAKDLLVLQRTTTHLRLFDMMRERASANQVASNPNASPLDPSIDVSGVWIEESSAGIEQKLGFHGVLGRLAGPTLTRMMRLAISKVTLEHTSSSFIIRGQQMFSMGTVYSYIIDGKFHPISPNHPITRFSSLTGISSPNKRQYVVFFDDPSRTLCIYIDFDIPFTYDKIVDWYPKWRVGSPGQNFRFYRIIFFRKTNANMGDFGFKDYFVPVEIDALNMDFIKNLVSEGVKCQYLAEYIPLRYYRFIMDSDINTDMIDLLLSSK